MKWWDYLGTLGCVFVLGLGIFNQTTAGTNSSVVTWYALILAALAFLLNASVAKGFFEYYYVSFGPDTSFHDYYRNEKCHEIIGTGFEIMSYNADGLLFRRKRLMLIKYAGNSLYAEFTKPQAPKTEPTPPLPPIVDH